MLKNNLNQFKKAELIKMANTRCVHRHTYLEHPQCYAQGSEKVGYLDIETSNLDADYGIILTWAILDHDTGEVLSGCISRDDIDGARNGDEDRRVVRELLDAMARFDRLITFYGTRFDIPYIRTRAIVMGLNWPSAGTVKHSDVYFTARFKLKLSRNSLENVCRTLLGKTDKTRLSGAVWRNAARGNKKALAYVMDHNVKDVQDTKKAFERLLPFTRLKDATI